MQRLAIVVVTRNSSGYLERCLDAVAGRGDGVAGVDNASEHGNPELVRRRVPAGRLCGSVAAAEGEH